jgi:hypothetical protein
MSLLENVAESFDASFQQNQFQVNKGYAAWSVTLRQQDRC